jgi:hypothetical protein
MPESPSIKPGDSPTCVPQGQEAPETPYRSMAVSALSKTIVGSAVRSSSTWAP